MPRVSLNERERKRLFDLACDNLIHLNDVLRQLEDDGADEPELAEWRQRIEEVDALTDKLAKAKAVR